MQMDWIIGAKEVFFVSFGCSTTCVSALIAVVKINRAAPWRFVRAECSPELHPEVLEHSRHEDPSNQCAG